MTAGRNLVLIGLMGAGKTTVGRLLAERLDRPFVDTDAEVEAEAGRSVAEIFRDQGEAAFRALEAGVIARVAGRPGQVVAVGGGAVCDPENVARLRASGVLVWLDASPEALAARVGPEQGLRPLLDSPRVAERLAGLLTERRAAYEAAADHRVGTEGCAPAAVADAVLGWARARPGLLAPEEARA